MHDVAGPTFQGNAALAIALVGRVRGFLAIDQAGETRSVGDVLEIKPGTAGDGGGAVFREDRGRFGGFSANSRTVVSPAPVLNLAL
jgi:hypothetical protein